MPILRYQNFWSGVFFGALGIAFLGASADLEVGNGAMMGPGYIPRLLAWFLVATGLTLVGMSWREAGVKLEPFALRPLGLALSSMVLCWLALDRIGLVLTVILVVVLSSFATTEYRAKEVPIVAVATSAAVALIFVVGLKLLIPLWPRF